MQVSLDQGASWINVDELTMEDKPAGKKVFSWTLWKIAIDAKKLLNTEVIVQVRAIDSKGKV